MALDVGTVVGKLGARLDTDGFDRFDRRLDKTRREADRGATAHLKTKADTRGIDQYERRLADVDDGHKRVEKSGHGLAGSLGGVAKTAAIVAGPTALFAVGLGLKAAFGAYKESERVAKQTNAVLKSTGEVAGVNAKHVNNLANAISRKTGIDDEAIQSSENLLLTFTNVRNEVGKGNDIFDQATRTVTDMSAALGQDAKSSSIQLGKALNDPIKGITALSRVGVSFTEQQKDQIKTLVKSGDTLGAQKIILKELGKEFGGSAEATATSSKKLGVTFGNLAENVGKLVSPAFEKVAGWLNTFVTGINEGSGSGGAFIKTMRTVGGVLGTVFGGAVRVAGKVLGGLKSIINENRSSLTSIGSTLSSVARTVGGALSKIAAAFRDTFSGNGTGKDVRNIISKVLELEAALLKVWASIAKRVIPGIVTAFRGLALILRGIIRVISGILSGDFGKAWDGVKDIFKGGVKYIAGVLRAGTAPARAAAAAIGKAVGGAFSAAWGAIRGTAVGFVNGIIDVINIIPGVNIHHVGGGGNQYTGSGGAGGGGGGINPTGTGGRQTTQKLAEGGKVTAPIAIMGEEAPQHPEWVIPTNPAYRPRAVGLWMAAARELGIPGFALGGLFDPGKALDFVTGLPGKAVKTAAGIAGKLLPKLPGNPGGILEGTFDYALDKAGDFIKGKAAGLAKAAASVVSSVGGGGGGGGAGTGGLVPQVVRALAWARAHGWNGGIISGYRDPANQIRTGTQYAASLGKSVAEVYPNGLLASGHVHGTAVDVGDPAGFARAMRGAPASSYIFNAIPWDPHHFSVSGHRRGGILGLIGGALGGERLAGGGFAFRKGGKTKNTGAKGEAANRGVTRSIARGAAGLASFEGWIQGHEREYSQADRRFGLSDEVFLVEHEDGSTTVDEGAVKARLGELQNLGKRRTNIRAKISAYRRAVQSLIDKYRKAIKPLKAALAAAKGKSRSKDRAGYREAIRGYQDRIAELGGVREDLGGDLVDSDIDLEEIRAEIATVSGTAGQAAPPKDPETPDTPDTPDAPDPSSPTDTAPTAPSALDIATGVAEALATFNAGRSDLFSQFGANFIGAGAGQPSPSQVAAGERYFGGGSSGSDGGVLAGAGDVNLNVTFASPNPPDPHTFAQAARFELEAAI